VAWRAVRREQAFHGRSTDQYKLNVPMKWVAETAGLQDLTIAKEGAGRLYYRIGMQYAPSNLKLARRTMDLQWNVFTKRWMIRRCAAGR